MDAYHNMVEPDPSSYRSHFASYFEVRSPSRVPLNLAFLVTGAYQRIHM